MLIELTMKVETAATPFDFIEVTSPEETPVWTTGLTGPEETAATSFGFMELTSPEETPVWTTDLTGVEGTAASPFGFTESGTPDNFIGKRSGEDLRTSDENQNTENEILYRISEGESKKKPLMGLKSEEEWGEN